LASLSDVRSAFKKLALQLHPDRQHSKPPLPLSVVGATCRGGAHSTASPLPWPFTFADVNEAYEVLSDDMKRMIYDADRQDALPSGPIDALYAPTATSNGGAPSDLEKWFRRRESEEQRPPTPQSMPFMSSSTLLAMDRRQLPEESHIKWEELFEQRRGVIGRRPLSRLSSSGGGRRHQLTPTEATSGRQQPGNDAQLSNPSTTATPSTSTTAARQQSSRLEMLRRARPSSGMEAVGPLLTDMHLRRDQLYHPHDDIHTPNPHPDVIAPPQSVSRPPLHTPSAGATGSSSQSTATTTTKKDSLLFSLPQFLPASCTPTATSPHAHTVPRTSSSPQPTNYTKINPREVRGGMSAARRDALGIGKGAAGRPQTPVDSLRSSASDRTMRLFFS
jgi:curved DNA-binding protein CbpA